MGLKNILFSGLVSLFLFSGCAIHKKNSLEKLCASKNIYSENMEAYKTLIKKGVDWRFLARVNDNYIENICEDLEDKKFPKSILKTKGLTRVEYSKHAASGDPDFEKEKEFVQNYIKEKLNERNHLFRENTDYSEHFSQVDSIQSKEMLFLIKKYIDFFNNEKNWPEIEQMFNDDEEKGGFILDGKKEYKILEIEQASYQRDKSKYLPSVTTFYVNKIGDFHTHPRRDSLIYPGPGGHAKPYGWYQTSDFIVQRGMSLINPFSMSTVISEIGDRKYNVDIYFQDLEKINGQILQNLEMTVLDLGVWDFNKKQ